MKHSKRYRKLKEKIDKSKTYDLHTAIEMVKSLATAKFDETVEVAVKLGLDPKREHVRGTAVLPHGTGKVKRVLALVEGEKAEEAKKGGADYVGVDEYLKKIEGGWFGFDVVVATPNLMPKIGKLGKILGPRGLMPNPKTGTLTENIGKAVEEIKKGRIEFKLDKTGCLHSPVGKVSFSTEALEENITELLKAIYQAKPSSVKPRVYIKKVHISSTMGVGVRLSDQVVEKIIGI